MPALQSKGQRYYPAPSSQTPPGTPNAYPHLSLSACTTTGKTGWIRSHESKKQVVYGIPCVAGGRGGPRGTLAKYFLPAKADRKSTIGSHGAFRQPTGKKKPGDTTPRGRKIRGQTDRLGPCLREGREDRPGGVQRGNPLPKQPTHRKAHRAPRKVLGKNLGNWICTTKNP